MRLNERVPVNGSGLITSVRLRSGASAAKLETVRIFSTSAYITELIHSNYECVWYEAEVLDAVTSRNICFIPASAASDTHLRVSSLMCSHPLGT